jgi:hypothetical protein
MKSNLNWNKESIVALFHNMIPIWSQRNKYLDSKCNMSEFNRLYPFIKDNIKESFIPLHVPHFGGNEKNTC